MNQKSTLKNKHLLLALFAIVLLAYACKKTSLFGKEGEGKVSSISIMEAKAYIDKQHIPILAAENITFSPILEVGGKLSYFWNKAIMSTSDSSDYIEVPISGIKKGYVIGADNPESANSSVTRMVIKKDREGNLSSFLVTIVPDAAYLQNKKEDIVKNSLHKKTANFCGFVLIHKPEGLFIEGQRFFNGKFVGKLTPIPYSEIPSYITNQAKVMNYALPGEGSDCIYYTMYDYNAVCYPVDANIICEWEVSIRWSYKVCEDGGGSYGTGGSGNNQFSIDQTALKECMKKIVDSLKKSTKGNVAAIIQQFPGETPGYNWTLKDGTLSSSWNAETSGKYNRTTGTVTTIFDSKKFAASSDLSVARTVLHESVHAYLLAYFFTNQLVARETYSEYYEEYIKHKNRSANTLQHNEIARNFVGYIGEALREYGDRMGYTFASQAEKEQYYNDLAWGGLTDTAAFRALNTSDKNRIEDVISSELAGIDRFGDPKPAKGSVSGCSN